MLTSILLSKSLMSDFNSLLTVSILLSSSLNLVSNLLSKSLISDFKVASTF
ncbi:hypothetical protein bpSLO_001487 (plasmid) [Borrelia parkeri]|nr:hypothetical protein bpSLO_001487 [Borrelia parkeri]